MRLLYQYIINKVSRDNCGIVIAYLKSKVATGLKSSEVIGQRAMPTDVIYNFITTSRPVEKWLQEAEKSIRAMKNKKVPVKLWVITGGYGAGKSHLKEYVVETTRRIQGTQSVSITLEVTHLLNADTTAGDNAFSMLLMQSIKYMEDLYDKLRGQENPDFSVKDKLREYLSDTEFINVFCQYGAKNNNEDNFQLLREQIIKKGGQVYLPLMKLFKEHLGINGICISIDEFEALRFLSADRRGIFLESVRSLYDELSNTSTDLDTPSFMIIILCTLTYWDELRRDTTTQGLETRVEKFEIPPLLEDEIIAIAEKLYVLYKKSGYLRHEIHLDFIKLPGYLAELAALEAALTPRFVITELINIIENPEKYIQYKPQ